MTGVAVAAEPTAVKISKHEMTKRLPKTQRRTTKNKKEHVVLLEKYSEKDLTKNVVCRMKGHRTPKQTVILACLPRPTPLSSSPSPSPTHSTGEDDAYDVRSRHSNTFEQNFYRAPGKYEKKTEEETDVDGRLTTERKSLHSTLSPRLLSSSPRHLGLEEKAGWRRAARSESVWLVLMPNTTTSRPVPTTSEREKKSRRSKTCCFFRPLLLCLFSLRCLPDIPMPPFPPPLFIFPTSLIILTTATRPSSSDTLDPPAL